MTYNCLLIYNNNQIPNIITIRLFYFKITKYLMYLYDVIHNYIQYFVIKLYFTFKVGTQIKIYLNIYNIAVPLFK